MLWAINDAGTAVGYGGIASDPNPVPVPGFIKPLDGGGQTVYAPDASLTQFYGINNPGQIVGTYIPSDQVQRGFIRLTDGTFQDLNCPGVVDNYTVPLGINDAGYIVGAYWEGGDSVPAFVRSTDGTCTTFSVPNSLDTWPTAINSFGQVVGAYWDDVASHGFVFNSLDK